MKANPEPKYMNKVVTTFNAFRLGVKKGFSEEMALKLRPEEQVGDSQAKTEGTTLEEVVAAWGKVGKQEIGAAMQLV